jgi:NitT/TauT family transport system permease protein
MTRLISLVALFALWQIASHFANPRLLPGPIAVLTTMRSEAASGALFQALGVTLARVAAAFLLAMAVGSAIGYAMGRNALIDRAADPWVIIVLAYIWVGLNEAAAIGAVALNKLPVTVVTIREGVRALDTRLDEMAHVFSFSPTNRLAHVVAPQPAPQSAAATRAGLSLVWKIVLVVELMGRPNGVGFEINTAFQLFDVPLLLAYALPFTAIMLVIETFAVQPFERHVSRWRPRAA